MNLTRFGFFEQRVYLRRLTVIVAFGFMTLSGGLDAYRNLLHRMNTVTLYTKEELALAEWAKENTGPETIWLTSQKPNHWLYNLTGRQTVIAHNGWLWTHGLRYEIIQQDVKNMFSNPAEIDLFRDYNIDYAVVGPHATSQLKVDTPGFQALFPVIKETDNYFVFDVKAGLTDTPIEPISLRFDTPAYPLGHTGLKRNLSVTIFDNIDFTGKPVKANYTNMHIGFWYDAHEDRPFPRPCSQIWEGLLKVEKEGPYTFYLQSDDGSWMELNGQEIIDNSGKHQVRDRFVRVHLAAGYHRLKIRYFDSGGGAILNLDWKPPEGNRVAIPHNLYFSEP